MTNLIRIHSQGKQATLYEGTTQVGKRVAVKQLSELVRDNPRSRDRIFQAARDWANLPHRHLLDYIDVDPNKGWIITDWVPQSIADAKPCSPQQGFRILRQSLEALQHLNEAGFFHGNIKPNNVRIDSLNDVCLSDGFLLSIDHPGVIPSINTPKYLAPELTGSLAANPGPGIDLYALGLTILEAIVGRTFPSLFPGIGRAADDHDMTWIQWHANPEAKLPPTSDLVEHCPPEVGFVIDRMLLKDPHARYRFAEQALADLPDSITDEDTAVTCQSLGPTTQPAPVEKRIRREHDTAPKIIHSAQDIMARPDNGVVVVVASGPDAGTTFGFDCHEFTVGCDIACDVPLASAENPESQLRIQLNSDGWSVSQLSGEGFFVNQTLKRSSSVLRSGDVVRMSWRGPDVQFYLQSGTPNVSELAAKYLPTPKRKADPRRGRRAPAGRPRRGAQNDIRQTRVITNPRTVVGVSQGDFIESASNAPFVPRPTASVRAASAPGVAPVAPTNRNAPRRPVAAAPTAAAVGASPSAPTRPHRSGRNQQDPLSPAAVSPQANDAHKDAADRASRSAVVWTDPKSWDKATRDRASIGATIAVAILAVLFFPAGGSMPEDDSVEPTSVVKQNLDPARSSGGVAISDVVNRDGGRE